MVNEALQRVVRRTVEKCIPFVVHVELTWRCNVHCTHCYLPEGRQEELSTKQWLEVFQKLKKEGTLFLALSGGEPFLRDDVFTLMRGARKIGLALRILTNGTLIDEDCAKELAVLCPAAVEISLLGGDAETHDGITGVKGSFAAVLKALRALQSNGVRTIVKVPVMRANWRNFKSMEAIANRYGAKLRYDVCISPRIDGDETPTQARLEAAELALFLKGRSGGEPSEIAPVSADALPCGAGQNAFSIGPDGTVHPCTALRLPLGNIVRDDFSVIKENPILLELRALSFGDLDGCCSCELAALCGRCPGVALIETGRFDGPSPSACQLGAILAELLKSSR